MRFPTDRHSLNTKLQARGNFGQRGLSAFSARQAVSDDADMVPPIDLSIRKIENVSKDSADRRPYRVQDAKWPL